MSPLSLNPAQLDVDRRGLLSCGFHCVLQMPTGSGKTWLAERAVDEVLARGGRALYLTPLRAQADELQERWLERFAAVPVGAYSGPRARAGTRTEVPYHRARVLIMTPERLDACTRWWRSHWSWLPEVELVVVDEFHLLADPSRGPRLEGTLGRLRRLNPLARVLALSATLGNREELADWLGGVEYSSDWRPIPLHWRTVRYRRAQDKPEVVSDVVRACVGGGGRSLVFVQSRRRAESLALHLAAAGLRARHHHAGLAGPVRRSVEQSFRSGALDVLVATATLEMGVNLPVRQVVLYDLQAFDGVDYRPLPVWSAWQRGGRAGRPGLDDRGEVVLLAPTWSREADRYLTPRFEPIRSALGQPAALAEQVVTEVATGLCRTEGQLTRALGDSLAAHQRRLPPIHGAVRTMLDAGMLAIREREDDRAPQLVATRLGRIAVRQMLAPETVLRLARSLEGPEAQHWTFFDLLLVACATPDAEPRLPVDFEELDELSLLLGRERSSLLTDLGRAEATLGCSGRPLLNLVKMAVCMRTWTRTGSVEEVAEETGAYPFEVQRLRESLERVLAAAQAIVAPVGEEAARPTLVVTDEPDLRERIKALSVMVEAGLDEEVVTLTLLPGIGPALARRLALVGLSDIEELAVAEPDDVAAIRGIAHGRAVSLVAAAEDLLPTRSAWCFKESGPTLRTTQGTWPPEVEPYRLFRAIELKVTKRGAAWLVTGGSDPHRVERTQAGLACDCPDHARGRTCKHLLAVRLADGDPRLQQLVDQLGHTATTGDLDLHALWLDLSRRASA
ncbi:MAG: DEAD/DEAH box helicase [Polyangiaceae bacterium]|nr:DEAD/DEAH box helicase [Polyangiaceae bacterium]